MEKKPVALIIGTGIGGLSCALALKNIGWQVRLFEKAEALRATGSGLSVMSNASAAMKKLLNIDLALEHYGAVMRNFEIRHQSGLLLNRLPFAQIASKQGNPNVCISRAQLQHALLDKIGDVEFNFNQQVVSYSETPDSVRVRFSGGTTAQGDILIGADGYYSKIREMIGTVSIIQPSNYICWLALVKFSHSQLASGDVIHYWGRGKRIGIIDIGNGWVYWWGTANMLAIQAQQWQGSCADIVQYYHGWPTIVKEIILATPHQAILHIDAKDRSFPQTWTKGRVTLLGDAAHPMLTSLGQGAGMSIEDAAVLGYLLKNSHDYPATLQRYQALRQPRTRAIVKASRALSDVEQYERFFPQLKRNAKMLLTPKCTLYKQLKYFLIFDTRLLL